MTGSVFYDYVSFELKVIHHLCDPERPGMVNFFSFRGDEGESFLEKEVIGNIYESRELLK